MTPLCVASVTSNAGTIVPAAEVLMCSRPPLVLFTLSANWLKLSMKVLDCGQLACMLSIRGAAYCCARVAIGCTLAASTIASAPPRRIDALLGFVMVLLLSKLILYPGYSFERMAEQASPAERKKRTISEIRDSKKTGEKMVYTWVLDYSSAKWAETAGVDVCVVGDSLAMTCHGHPNTIPATMDMMVLHAAAVRRGAPNTFVLGCMPYQSYHTVERALANATRFMQEAACDAVKPQGGKSQAHVLKALVDAGIPTASHIGLTPHTIAMFGGFKIQGRTAETAMKILEDALAIEDAGCFMLEFEAVPAKIARLISEQVSIPTIGIGAGVGTDGQILLCHDLLGVFTDFKPKFTKRYAKLTEVAVAGIKQYIEEVKEGAFPDDDHSYAVDNAEYEKFAAMVAK